MSDTLWIITGTQPVAWQIPLWGIQKGDRIELVPAVPLLNCQKIALHQQLSDNYGFYEQGIYRIAPIKLKMTAQPQPPGTQPEEMLVWGPRRKPHRLPERMERNEFIDDMMLLGLGSRAQCEFWFKSICNLMLDWLLNKDRTVDLYFLRLVPTHLSRDWFRRLNGAHNNYATPKYRESQLLSGNPIRMKSGRCVRRVEVGLTNIWRQLAKKVESRRMEVLKFNRYASVIERLLVGQKEFWSRQFSAQRNDWLAVSTGIIPCNPPGSKKLILKGRPIRSRTKRSTAGRKGWLGRTHRDTLRQLRARIEKRNALVGQLGEIVRLRQEVFSHFATIPEAIAILRELPNVRSFLSDLRNPNGMVGEPANETERAIRMLVCNSPSKLNGEKLLVKQLQRRESGLAARVEQLPK